MGDQFYQPPHQFKKECQFLERNYIFCLLQKGLKDRVGGNKCDLESVLWFHLECPDYVKKFDEPMDKSYLKRQIFNLLLLPYINTRVLSERNNKQIKVNDKDLRRKGDTIEYPEELKIKETPLRSTILKNKRLSNKFFEGYEEFDVESRFAKPESQEGGEE